MRSFSRILKAVLIVAVFGTVISKSSSVLAFNTEDLKASEALSGSSAEIRSVEPLQENDRAVSFYVNPSAIPSYSGSPYIILNNNLPGFSDAEMTTTAVETYSNLDALGRCGVCYANIGKEIMSTGERGAIGSVKPTGWSQDKYPGIVDSDLPYLYNRCHLIGYQLEGSGNLSCPK